MKVVTEQHLRPLYLSLCTRWMEVHTSVLEAVTMQQEWSRPTDGVPKIKAL
jgi:hypothetical protein